MTHSLKSSREVAQLVGNTQKRKTRVGKKKRANCTAKPLGGHRRATTTCERCRCLLLLMISVAALYSEAILPVGCRMSDLFRLPLLLLSLWAPACAFEGSLSRVRELQEKK